MGQIVWLSILNTSSMNEINMCSITSLKSVNHQYSNVAKPLNTSPPSTNTNLTKMTIYHNLITDNCVCVLIYKNTIIHKAGKV